MPEPLTPIERNVYHYLIDFLAENTYQPSIRDIGKRFRIKSTKTVSDLLQSLAEKGYIERDPSRSRGVRLLGFAASRKTQPVPVYGQVQAGDSPLSPEFCQGHLTVDRRFLPSENVFYLRVKGNDMATCGICNGDYVLVNPSTRVIDGQVVAARLHGEATVRKLTHRGASVVLEADGEGGERHIVVEPRDEFDVLGVICGVFRPYYDRGQPDRTRQSADDGVEVEEGAVA